MGFLNSIVRHLIPFRSIISTFISRLCKESLLVAIEDASIVLDEYNNQLYKNSYVNTEYDPRVPFIIEIDTTLGNGFNSFQIPTRSTSVYDMDVKVSDGQEFNISAWDQAETLIQFASAGVYTIEVKGYCGSWFDSNTGDVKKYTNCYDFGDLEFGTCDRMFYGASNIRISCNNGPYMPTGTDMSYMLRESGITCVPSNIFDRTPLVNDINNMMAFCYSISGLVPSLYNLKYLINCSSFMLYTRSLILPDVLFDLDTVDNITNIATFMKVAHTGFSYTGTLQPIWDYVTPTLSGKSTAFENNILLTNYTQLRTEWP